MSEIIQCDRCKDLIEYPLLGDNYYKLRIEGMATYHLCIECYASFLKDFLHEEEHKRNSLSILLGRE